MIVSLTDAGRQLREKGLEMDLAKESGLSPAEFKTVQNAVVTVRNSLVKATRARQ